MAVIEATKEKFKGLTAEQKKKLDSVQDADGFRAFVAETGIELNEEEMAHIAEMFETGKIPLSDDDMEKTAGGMGASWWQDWQNKL